MFETMLKEMEGVTEVSVRWNIDHQLKGAVDSLHRA